MVLSGFSATGQNGRWQTGAAEAGIANATAAYTQGNILFHNVGALGFIDRSRISFGYDYRGFVEGLNNVSLQVLKAGDNRSIGLGIFKSGDDVLNEFVASVGIGQRLGLASLGVKVNYYQTFSEAYGYRRVYSISAGGIAQLSPEVLWGTYIENAGRYTGAEGNIELPVKIATGFSYHPTDNLMLAVSGQLTPEDPIRIQTGFAYTFLNALDLRMGINWAVKNFHFGLGYNIGQFEIDYAFTPVQPLGNMHSVTLNVYLKQNP